MSPLVISASSNGSGKKIQFVGSDLEIETPIDLSAFPTRYSVLKVDHSSPLAAIAQIYAESKDLRERQACLNYLLYTQHGNAELTVEESLQLGYPAPLYAPQISSGYVRTEYNRLFETAQTWVDQHFVPFMTKGFMMGSKHYEFLKLSTRSAIDALRTLYRGTKEISSLEDYLAKGKAAQASKSVVIIPLSPDELKLDVEAAEIIQRKLDLIPDAPDLVSFRKRYTSLKFLFVFSVPDVDCSILLAAAWKRPKTHSQMTCLRLKAGSVFGNQVFCKLNRSGAVPDRVSVNKFLTHELGTEPLAAELEKIGSLDIGSKLPVAPKRDVALGRWLDTLKLAESLSFDDDPGAALYRDAMLRWWTHFIQPFGLEALAAPLLASQVSPWITKEANLVQWAKAYQNLCEIGMFCLQAYPDRFGSLDLDTVIRKNLSETSILETAELSTGLFSYAMKAVSWVVRDRLRRPDVADRPLTIASINQHYFETLTFMEDLKKQGQITTNTVKKLSDLHELPDMLIADIHPNNAARSKLFQNSVADWVDAKLKADPTKQLSLILDITLNHLQDPIVQKTLETLAPHIASGQLEIFAVQSLAKLVQLGADNFSGGLCFHLTQKDGVRPAAAFPPAIQEKARYFALLLNSFPDLIGKYIDLVRRNSDWMYTELNRTLEEIEASTWVKKGGESEPFTAAKVALNGDDGTVYVAISFKPLLKLLETPIGKYEDFTDNQRKLLLELSAIRDLILTGRQSFGFTLSNMSTVVSAIRFSIGVENQTQLSRNAELIGDFLEALSRYAAADPDSFEFDTFAPLMRQAVAIAHGKKDLPPLTLPLSIELEDYLTLPSKQEEIDWATVKITGGELSLEIEDSQIPDTITVITQDEINPMRRCGIPYLGWNTSLLTSLAFKILSGGDSALRVSYLEPFDSYFLYAGEPDRPLFIEDHRSQTRQGYEIIFEPEFSLKDLKGQSYSETEVYTVIESLGGTPVKLSRLPQTLREQVFQSMVSKSFDIVPHKAGCLLQFGSPLRTLDYYRWLRHQDAQGGLPAALQALHTLDLQDLPLPMQHRWNDPISGISALTFSLEALGSYLWKRPVSELMPFVTAIKHAPFRHAVMKGILNALCKVLKDDKLRPLSLRQGAGLAALFRRCPLPLGKFYAEVKEHLHAYNRILACSTEDPQRVKAYVRALFPLIQRTFCDSDELLDTEHSVHLQQVALRLDYAPIRALVYGLEEDLIGSIPSKKAKLKITEYLNFCIYYPYRQQDLDQLLQTLSKLPEEQWLQWLQEIDFHHTEVRPPVWEDEDVDYFFGPRDAAKIHEFLAKTGCMRRLAHLERSNPLLVKRWRIMCGILKR